MEKSYILLVFVTINLCYCNTIMSAPKYPVNEIPKPLMEKAKTVIRLDDTQFEIKSDDRADVTITRVFTVLNENGIEDAEMVIYYDGFKKVKKVKAVVYDQHGKKIKRIRRSDIVDVSAISGFTLYNDYRVKYVDPEIRAYPYTVEYTIEISHNGLLNYPKWQPYKDYNISVEQSRLQVIFPKDKQVRYLENNFTGEKSMSTEDNKTSYTWDTTHLKALTKEPYSPSLHEFTPVVHLAPNNFEIDGYKGNASSWQQFGRWIYQMNEGRQELPEETKKEIKKLIADLEDPYEKVKILYQYMQHKTRYVSIQVGIGGWQPFPAEFVDNKSYGDCKALSNYMQAILQVAGIESYYTLVKAGSNATNIHASFPSNQFNHAILCVPNQQDTLWLECTSQKMPCGYIGSFTDDRDVLIITPEGGELTRTKEYTAAENLKVTHARVEMTTKGHVTASMNNIYKGLYSSEVASVFSKDDTDKKKFMEQRNWSMADYVVKSFDHELEPHSIPIIYEQADIEVPHYGSLLGGALLFAPNVFNKIIEAKKLRENRTREVHIRRAYTEVDTIEVVLPEYFVVSNIPEAMEVKSVFGQYRAEIKLKNGNLLYIRNLRMNKGRYEPALYTDYYAFLEQIHTYDQQKIASKKE